MAMRLKQTANDVSVCHERAAMSSDTRVLKFNIWILPVASRRSSSDDSRHASSSTRWIISMGCCLRIGLYRVGSWRRTSNTRVYRERKFSFPIMRKNTYGRDVAMLHLYETYIIPSKFTLPTTPMSGTQTIQDLQQENESLRRQLENCRAWMRREVEQSVHVIAKRKVTKMTESDRE